MKKNQSVSLHKIETKRFRIKTMKNNEKTKQHAKRKNLRRNNAKHVGNNNNNFFKKKTALKKKKSLLEKQTFEKKSL